jgi:O-antigen/teichoic acid export membrane protein
MDLIKKIKKKLKGKDGNADFSEILKGGSIALVYRVASMVLSYALMVYVSRELGESGIGIYNLCLAISGILVMVASMGFNSSIVRFTSQYSTLEKHYLVRAVFKGIVKLTVPLSIVMGLVFFFLAETLAVYVYHDESLILPFKLIGVILPLSVIGTINVEFIRGLKDVHISELFRNLVIQFINLAAFSLAIYLGIRTIYAVDSYALGVAIAGIYTSYYIWRYFKRKKPNEIQASTEDASFSMKEHLVISLPMIMTSFIQLLNGKVDTIMLGIYTDTAAVGIFSVALKISIITNFMISSLKTIALPKISELYWKEDMKNLKIIVRKSTNVIMLFSIPISLILLIFPELILSLVKESFTSGATTLRILAFTQLLNSMCGLVGAFMNMTGHQAYFTRLVIISTVVNIVLNVLWIPIWGMEGAAWATLVSTSIWNIAGGIFIYRKYQVNTFFSFKWRK